MRRAILVLIVTAVSSAACMTSPTSPNSNTTRDIQFGFFSSATACKNQAALYQCRDYSYSSTSGACTGLRCSK